MKLTEINDIILGNVDLPVRKKFKELPDLTNSINEAIRLCDGLYNKSHFIPKPQTLSYTEFYTANPLMDAFISDWWSGEVDTRTFKKELFYSMVAGVYVPTVPSELTALFVLTRREYDTPNKMISALDKSHMKSYLDKQIHSNKRIMKELLDKIWGYEVNLVTKERPMVTNKDAVEIYIDNINDILVCNENIKDILTNVDDIKDLRYSTEKGIVLGDSEIPLRTLIQTFGITDDDLDLRRVYLADETHGDIQY